MNVNFNDKTNICPAKLSQNNLNRNNYNRFNSCNNQSFKGLEQIAENVAGKIVASPKTQNLLKNNTFNKLLKTAIENPGLYEAFIALLVTCTARPLTILATPGAKMEDKQYASAQSIASGISGLAFAYAAFDPITSAIDKILINVNGENVKKAFQNFYSNPKNKELVKELVSQKIIPDAKTFNEATQKNPNIFGYLKTYLKENGAKKRIEDLLAGDDIVAKQKWSKLSREYSEGIKKAFSKIKDTKVPNTKKYLVHNSLEFMKEGAYKLKVSAGADKAKFLINYTSKIILFPLTAGVTIWAIPKIMKLIFPNHKKSKKISREIQNQSTTQKNNTQSVDMKNFEKFKNNNNKVSFAGGLGSISKVSFKIYEKTYKNPLSTLLSKVFDFVAGSKPFSKRIDHLLSNSEVKKYGMKVIDRDKSGKILAKWDNDFFASYLPQIAALFGSCLYILNTIRNKEIDPERKPTLCTNMAVVAILSLLAGKSIDKISTPIFDALKKTHSGLMGNKLNYDHEAAWKCARSLMTTTLAFRYLGPVLATPIADKLVRLFKQPSQSKNN